MTELKFLHVGMDHVVCANRIIVIAVPQTKSSQRLIKKAKEQGVYIDATVGRSIKSVLYMDDGSVIVSAIKPKTLLSRMNNIQAEENENASH